MGSTAVGWGQEGRPLREPVAVEEERVGTEVVHRRVDVGASHPQIALLSLGGTGDEVIS